MLRSKRWLRQKVKGVAKTGVAVSEFESVLRRFSRGTRHNRDRGVLGDLSDEPSKRLGVWQSSKTTMAHKEDLLRDTATVRVSLGCVCPTLG